MIEGVSPELDGGRFPIKRVPGEEVRVEADVFADGHDLVAAALRFRQVTEDEPREVPMLPLYSAIGVDLYTYGAPHNVAAEEMERRIRSWGIGPGTKVVIYDEGASMTATWIALRHL